MTIGIYALYWEDQDLIYIGQSINIESRIREHTRKMQKCEHENYKVQNAYGLYGAPTSSILEIVPTARLDTVEEQFIEEFDSIVNGLNIMSGGRSGRGLHAGNSQLSQYQVLRVFSFLYKTNLPYSVISLKTGIPTGNIANIKRGGKHIWLSEKYPEQYAKMLSRDKSVATIRNTSNHGTLVHTSGITSGVIDNINLFCRSQPTLNSCVQTTRKCINEVLKGTKVEYRGWTLSKNLDQTNYTCYQAM